MVHLLHQNNEKLTFVLTLAISGTGRDDQDIQRAQLLLKTIDCFFDKNCLEQFIIITPAKDAPVLRQAIASYMNSLKITILDENEICPEFSNNPDTTDSWPKPNTGWFRQQLIKLAIYEHVNTQFYMTLDSDVILIRDFDTDSLIHNGKAIVNVQREDDYAKIYTQETVANEVKVRRKRYTRAESILQCHRKKQYLDQWYGETPVLLNKHIVKLLTAHLECSWNKPWRQALLDRLPWTEYPLYFLFAEDRDILNDYYVQGNVDSVLRLTKSLWLPPDDYQQQRDLTNWDLESVFGGQCEGIAVAVQSYLGYPVDQVVTMTSPYIK